jgi:hypothetical protein
MFAQRQHSRLHLEKFSVRILAGTPTILTWDLSFFSVPHVSAMLIPQWYHYLFLSNPFHFTIHWKRHKITLKKTHFITSAADIVPLRNTRIHILLFRFRWHYNTLDSRVPLRLHVCVFPWSISASIFTRVTTSARRTKVQQSFVNSEGYVLDKTPLLRKPHSERPMTYGKLGVRRIMAAVKVRRRHIGACRIIYTHS